MKCPRCQQENPAEQNFCGECGTPRTGATQASPHADLREENEKLRRSLTEALEQQMAAAQILRVISNSPIDVQPVFDTIIKNAVRVCDAKRVASSGSMVSSSISWPARPVTACCSTLHRLFPRPPGRDSPTARAVLTGRVTSEAMIAPMDLGNVAPSSPGSAKSVTMRSNFEWLTYSFAVRMPPIVDLAVNRLRSRLSRAVPELGRR